MKSGSVLPIRAIEHRPGDGASTFSCASQSSCDIDVEAAPGPASLDVLCTNGSACTVASRGLDLALQCDSGSTCTLAIDSAGSDAIVRDIDIEIDDANADGTVAGRGEIRCITSTCDVVATPSPQAQLTLVCDGGTCAFACAGDDACVMRCDAGDACDFDCAGAATSCSGPTSTAVACNTTCPPLD